MSAPLLGAVPAWHERGLCQQTDPELFYPEQGAGPARVREAKAVCARCEVRTECREYAIATGEVYGVWGGTSESERRRMRGLARAREARLLREAEEASC